MERSALLETDGDGRYFLARPLDHVDALTGTAIHVPRGFETDLASVPRFFWPFIAPTGLHARAAVVHDWLYRTPGHGLSRWDCDRIFRELMAKAGVRWSRRWVIWAAVRLGGWAPWGRLTGRSGK